MFILTLPLVFTGFTFCEIGLKTRVDTSLDDDTSVASLEYPIEHDDVFRFGELFVNSVKNSLVFRFEGPEHSC